VGAGSGGRVDFADAERGRSVAVEWARPNPNLIQLFSVPGATL
jgi:hypothetical protein